MGVTFIAPAEQFTSPAVLISKEITEDGTYYAADDNANGYSSVEVSVSKADVIDFAEKPKEPEPEYTPQGFAAIDEEIPF